MIKTTHDDHRDDFPCTISKLDNVKSTRKININNVYSILHISLPWSHQNNIITSYVLYIFDFSKQHK